MRLIPAADAEPSTRVRVLLIYGLAAVLLVSGAVLLGLGNHTARVNGPLANEAFVDTEDTAEVVAEITAAVKTVYSYDHNALDVAELAAKEMITGPFAAQFDKVFGPVKELAPQQQVSLSTTVQAAGVLQLAGDRARLLMMVDQGGTKGGSQPVAGASSRLVVQAHRTDGRWKIAEVTPE
ncbi:MAG: hypothetical protein ACT4O0_06355 [Pseudonocardia sp.]